MFTIRNRIERVRNHSEMGKRGSLDISVALPYPGVRFREVVLMDVGRSEGNEL